MIESSGGRRRFRRVLARISVLTSLLAITTSVIANCHTYQIEQIYSNTDGSVQFVVLRESMNANGQEFWTNHVLKSVQGAATPSTFVFPHDLPGDNTARTHVLIGTQGFAALGLITPDYVVPNGFVPLTQGSVNFADVDELGYASLPIDGVHALYFNGAVVQNVATNFAGQTASVPASTSGGARNYEGLWWKAPANSESGWGINFAHQGDVIFATWFTYDATGKAWWLVMTATKTADATYSGTLYSTHGPAFNAVPFSPSGVAATSVGTATLTFS